MPPETRPAISILAKAPVPGFAKTRLIPHLGAEGAAALQRWLLQRSVAAAVIADLGPVTLWCAPDTTHEDFRACRAYGPVSLKTQPPLDLGARMLHAVEQSPSTPGTLIIGTDCPLLSAGVLREAALDLATHDAVVIPAEDGGYALIGLHRVAPEVFDGLAWSTPQVMAETRERFVRLGWSWKELPALWDVDVATDFERLASMFPDVRQGLSETAGVA